ncbi:MAG: hypothetical protein ACE5HP_12310 [Gemmatimonadota bacterium]
MYGTGAGERVPRAALTLAVAAWAVACTEGGAPSSSPREPGATPVVLRLDPYFRELRTLAVEVGGDTLPFLFDTGGGVSLVTPSVAEALACSPHGRKAGFRMRGEPVEFRLCDDVTLRVAGLEVPHRTIAVWDLMAVLPEGFPPLGGLVSLQTFQDRALTVDLAAGELIVETAASLAARTSAMKELEARIATGIDGGSLTLFVAANTPQGKLWFLLDSGNIDRTLLAPHAAFEQLGLSRPDERSRGAGGRVELSGVPLPLVGLEPQRTPVAVQRLIYDGVLGAAFLRDRAITLDLFRGRAWASPRRGGA